MARAAGPGRTALLDAGTHMLRSTPLGALSVNTVVAAAGMAKGSFYQHWPSRSAYLRDLHDRFHDHLARTVGAAADGPPGAHRLAGMLDAYLDGCLAHRAAKSLLVEARTDAGLLDLVETRNADFADMIVDDLAVLGWSAPRLIATLLIAAVAEIALHELAAGAGRPDLRQAALALATRRT
jgi:TetR/AcrR family transcriptional regulator, transcriptional repressor for nem operon